MRTIILVLSILISGWMTATAQSTHVVRAGETLFSISREFDVTVQQLREWNNLTNNNIHIGQRLIVGTTDETPGGEATSAGQPAGTITHTVEPGQTLFRISRMYHVSIDDIRAWNRLEDNAISIGQELTIRVGATSSVAPHSPGTVTDTLEETPAEQVLHIRSQSIAPPSITAEWDMESTPQGKFVRYTIGDGDSLHQILQYHQMDLNDFRALNPDTSPSDIRPGDEVTLLLATTSPQRNPYRVQSTNRAAHQVQVSRYPDNQRGKTTTSGDLYNPSALTAAHPNLALGSVVYVENPETGHGIYVLVNDRTTENRLLLSDAAFRALHFNNATSLIARIDEQPD